MNKIPPIPWDVPLSHRNYDISKGLLEEYYLKSPGKPYYASNKAWEKLKEAFEEFASNSKEKHWKLTESFFEYLKENQEDLEEGDIKGIFLDILDIEDKKEIADEHNWDPPEELKNISHPNLRENVSMIDDAIEKALSFIKSKKSQLDWEYQEFENRKADIRELARTNAKWMLADDMLSLLAMKRALEGELNTLKSVEPGEKVLYIMVDDSGSMDTSAKRTYLAYIFRRIKEKMEKDKNMAGYVFRFESRLFEDSRTDLRKEKPKFHLSGGGTDIHRSLMELFDIMKEDKVDRASILVINDGQDHIGDIKPPCKVTAIMLGQNNNNLRNVCKKSGGVGYMIRL